MARLRIVTLLATSVLALGMASGTALADSSSGQNPQDADHAGSSLNAPETGPVLPVAPKGLPGLDVSAYQGKVNWKSVAKKGAAFAYVKATEGSSYTSPTFSAQYDGAYKAGLIRGAYHFARPNASGGRQQADFFLKHGGGWSADGKTLPGALDVEYGPNGNTCWGLSKKKMVSWISAFNKEYHKRAGRYPAIYTTTNWWAQCTGNTAKFGKTNPLWLANFSGTFTPLPHGWKHYTIWQHANHGKFPGDQDVFRGSRKALRAFALAHHDPELDG